MVRLSRRMLLALAPVAPFVAHAVLTRHAKPAAKTMLYVGTYTHDMGPGGKADGIYMAEWDATAGRLGRLRRAVQTTDPSFLAVAPSGKALYAVNEAEDMAESDGSKGGSVTAFHRDPVSGALTQQNVVPSGGSDPCHITVDRSGKNVFVVNYTSGTLTSYRVTESGLKGPVAHIVLHGHGPNAERQTGPHTHGVLLSPDERFLLVNDLGIDRVMVFRVDLATAGLRDTGASFHARPGSGPRHSAFHPNGKWVYCLNEILSTVDVLAWNAQTGALKPLGEVPLLAEDFHGHSTAAQVVIDHAGTFLYASNRGEDTLAVFAIDASTGALTFVQRVTCGGKTPRDFSLDPMGKWLVCANQDSQNIVVFARDSESGKLTMTKRSYKLGAPVAILFVAQS